MAIVGFAAEREFPSRMSLSGTLRGRDQKDFAEFYSSGEAEMTEGDTVTLGVCVTRVRYAGQAAVERDTENLKLALEAVDTHGAFMSALSPEPFVGPGRCHATREEEMRALAEAMREEYKAITDAGLDVQVDDPYLVNTFECDYSVDWDMKGYRQWAEQDVELVNYALEAIPEQQVRYHVCWGSWRGPHSSDLPLRDAVDLILKVNASQYSIEGANAQHEHEWEVWTKVKLPPTTHL